MISARYAIPTAVLIGLALIPTTIHSYVGIKTNDGRTTRAIGTTLAGMPSQPTARKAEWVIDRLESRDWIERSYDDQGVAVTLFVGRSYDAKRLYHHPELALLRGYETTPAGVGRSADRPDIPLHLVTTTKSGRTGLAVYALMYDGRFIENPIWFQLRTSAALLVSPPKPMTLFLANALAGGPRNVDRAPATRVVLAAIDDFLKQPSGQAKPED
jgi:hypothetical protein